MSAFMLSANALSGAVALGAGKMMRGGRTMPRRVAFPGTHSVRAKVGAIRAVATETEKIDIKVPPRDGTVRVRFAPSPTGNLHVGGARTALFNWLYAKNQGGKFILRVEDTDTARSTRESEEAMIRDLKWMGLDWDEGPDVGGPYGPYRQSERAAIYKQLALQLVEEGYAYPCFCTDAELEKMKEEAEAKKLPPKYMGKWATATKEEVEAEFAKGTPACYRFRVPEGERVEIDDMIRGKVGWDTDTLGDFVLLRSNGLPVYNFCVAVDDATMGITHVLRAEEHLPNTLRQALVYDALKFPRPIFGHMSLILAPDRSKLSKRHGATSVGQFKDQGYLKETMINYLSQLGWNDGTEQEIYTTDELKEKFGVDRINKSPAVFDVVKLNWMNGQHIRLMSEEEQVKMVGAVLVEEGLAESIDSPYTAKAVALCANGIELVQDAAAEVKAINSYPLKENLEDAKMKKILEDDFGEIADAVVAGFESGELQEAIKNGEFKGFINGVGKALGRKGKRLFMPMRVALTGRMQGPDVGEVLDLLATEGVPTSATSLAERVEALKAESGAWAK